MISSRFHHFLPSWFISYKVHSGFSPHFSFFFSISGRKNVIGIILLGSFSLLVETSLFLLFSYCHLYSIGTTNHTFLVYRFSMKIDTKFKCRLSRDISDPSWPIPIGVIQWSYVMVSSVSLSMPSNHAFSTVCVQISSTSLHTFNRAALREDESVESTVIEVLVTRERETVNSSSLSLSVHPSLDTQ